jgi:aspartyl/asparaginyl beta-hydroxylase (cupin superfamily)
MNYFLIYLCTKELEANYETIQGELLNLLEQEASVEFNEYIGDGISSDKSTMTSKGEWKVFYFWQQFNLFENNCARCPKTAELLKRLQREDLLLAGMVCFSSLMPNSHIKAHTGPSNMRLTCHLGLLGCDGSSTIRVGEDTCPFLQGKCIVFDDSYLHEVHHTGKNRRVTLMLDFWHPGMLQVEKDVFQLVMHNSQSFMHPDEFFHSLKMYSLKKFVAPVIPVVEEDSPSSTPDISEDSEDSEVTDDY